MRKYIAEFLGTFMLVGIGTGSIVYSAASTQSPLTVALAFGLALAIAIYYDTMINNHNIINQFLQFI